MKHLLLLLLCSIFILHSACQSEMDEQGISVKDSKKTLSHAPTDAVSLTVGSNGFVIDFGCDQEMTEHIFSPHGHYFSIGGDKKSVDDIKNLGDLVSYYRNLHCVYEYGYSSMFNPSFDADYVVTKFEFLLAQECFQDDCSTESRKIIMSAVIDKQKRKYIDYQVSYTARRSGLFLMAVIMLKEQYAPFVESLKKQEIVPNVLSLNEKIAIIYDSAFRDVMLGYAEKFLLTTKQ